MHSLIDLNQLHRFGIKVYDNPYTPYHTQQMGILFNKNIK